MNTGTDHTADYKSLSPMTSTLMIGILLFSAISIVLSTICLIVFANFLFFLIVSMALAERFIKFPTCFKSGL